MGSRNWTCDPPLLRAAAKSVEMIAGEFGEDFARQQNQLAPPRSKWATTQATEAASSSWVAFLSGLHAGVDDYGSGLRGTANSYTSVDSNAAHLLEKGR